MNAKINRISETNYNNFGSLMKIVDYRKANDIDVYFPEYDWTFKHARYSRFLNGQIKCPYEPRTYGVGYIGDGLYKPSQNGIQTKCYDVWNHMLQRCYSELCREKYPTYEDCYVCDEWLNYQNFAEWYENNYYEVGDEQMNLDKDILYKGNRVYSPETCIFVPHRINSLFIKSNNTRGKCPIGVNFDARYNKYNSHCNNGNGIVWLGSFDNMIDAFQVYKDFKENLIKQVADEYRDFIPYELYNVLYNYEVDIND